MRGNGRGRSKITIPERSFANGASHYHRGGQSAGWLFRNCKTSPIRRIPEMTVSRQLTAFEGYRSKSRIKVCLIGADSAVGAPLAMLIQQSKIIEDLTLYGRQRPERLAAELSCIPSKANITAYGSQDDGLCCALDGAQVVLLADGAFRSGAIKREDHFRIHAKAACEYGKAIGLAVPNALVGVLTTPTAAMLPVVWECFRRAGGRQPERRVMGVVSLPEARVVAQASRVLKVDPASLKVYIAGGTSGSAAVPILSALAPHLKLTQLEASAITASVAQADNRIRKTLLESFGSIKACEGNDSDPEDCGDCSFGGHTNIGMFLPTFSIAYAASKFVDAAVRAATGHSCVRINVFVVSHVVNNSAVFATTPVLLGRNGVFKRLPQPIPSEYEASLLDAALESVSQDLVLARSFLTEVFGESKRPTGMPEDCSISDWNSCAGSTFRVCGEDFYPPSPSLKPECSTAPGCFLEEDPCEELVQRAKESVAKKKK